MLLDLKLPKVDELEVLKRVKSDPDLRKSPLVMLTSSHEERDLVKKPRFRYECLHHKASGLPRFCRSHQESWALLGHQPGAGKLGAEQLNIVCTFVYELTRGTV
jgi:CheY-like chemotaxis protein